MALSLPRQSPRRTLSILTKTSRPVRRAFRPCMAALENRCVPSTLTVTSSADDVTQNHTLRYAVAHAQSGDTIQLTAAIKGPIVLTQGELVLSKNVTIESVPSRTPTISGNGLSRVFEIAAGASVALDNLTIIDGNGVADNPAGGYDGLGGAILNQGTVMATDVQILDNTASVGGGAIFTFGPSSTIITNSTLSGNTSGAFGGGISNAGYLAITGTTLSSNSAFGSNGGGIDTIGNVVLVSDVIQGNFAAGGGAAVSVDAGSLTDHGSTISNNTADLNAGAIFNFFTGTLNLTGTTLADNASLFGYGGAVSNWGTATITGGSIHNNSAPYGGGAIDNFVGSLGITGTSITGNASGYYGGGIDSNFATLSVTNSTIAGNTTANYGDGGGIYSYASTVTISGGTISGNTAASYGGGLYGIYGTATISGSTISGNTAANSGGGVYNDSGNTETITGGSISGNSATYSGGGLFNNDGGSVSVTGSSVTGNSLSLTFGLYGGGLFNYGTMTIAGSSVSNNTGGEFGGGIGNIGTLTVTNSALTGNTSTYAGGGIYNDYGASATVTGSTLSYNSALYGGGIDNWGTLYVGTSTFHGNTPDDIEGGFVDLGGNTF